MFQVEVLRERRWQPAGAYVMSNHAVDGAKTVSLQQRDVTGVRVTDLSGRVIFSHRP